jgi:hypothetical protein
MIVLPFSDANGHVRTMDQLGHEALVSAQFEFDQAIIEFYG